MMRKQPIRITGLSVPKKNTDKMAGGSLLFKGQTTSITQTAQYRKGKPMIKAHKIRLNPTSEQAHYFAKAAGTARYTFNWALAEWKKQYEAGEKPSALGLRTRFHALRKVQLPWTYDVTKCVIEGAFMDVAAAFKNFFEGRKAGRKAGYPKFVRCSKLSVYRVEGRE
jgi:transposase